jgi:tetratricopeptide (TPR) repeat protein
VRWAYFLGLVELQLGDPLAASEHLDVALRLLPDHVPTRLALGLALQRLGRPDQAALHFKAALAGATSAPQRAVAYCGLGRVLAAQNNDLAAVEQFKLAVNLEPAYGLAHYAAGQCLRRLQRLPEAEAALARAEEHARNEPDIDDELWREVRQLAQGAVPALHDGIALLKQGRAGEALPSLRRAVDLRPDLAEAHCALATALLEAGEADEARNQFLRTLEIDPGYVQALYNLGVLAHRQKNYEEASQYFTRVCAVRPDHFEAHFALGRDLLRIGLRTQAVTHARAALELQPADPGAAKQLAEALLQDRRPREAVVVLREACRRTPADASLRDRLAWTLATAPDLTGDDAAEALSIAEEVCATTRWGLPQPIDTLAAALARLGRFDEARERAAQALELARSSGRSELADDIQQRLDLYMQGRPYLERPEEDPDRSGDLPASQAAGRAG